MRIPTSRSFLQSEREVAIVAFESRQAAGSGGEYRVEVKIDIGMPALLVGETDESRSRGRRMRVARLRAGGRSAGVPRRARSARSRVSSESWGPTRPSRRNLEPRDNSFEPDFGDIDGYRPGRSLRQLQLELRGAQARRPLHVGRNYAALRESEARARCRGASKRAMPTSPARSASYRFSNLTSSIGHLSGGVIGAHTNRGVPCTWSAVAPPLGATSSGPIPTLSPRRSAMVRGWVRMFFDRLEVFGRSLPHRTSSLREFSFDYRRTAGRRAGVSDFTLVPAVQLIADGSYVLSRRARLERGQVRRQSYPDQRELPASTRLGAGECVTVLAG